MVAALQDAPWEKRLNAALHAFVAARAGRIYFTSPLLLPHSTRLV